MKTIVSCSAVFLMVSMVLAAGPAGSHARTITGRIVAYRPVERVVQVGSFVKNREKFLFQVEQTKKGIGAAILIIDYQHFGYSDITESMLEKGVLLRLKVTRDKSGDESYDHFVTTAPTLRDESSGAVGMTGIVFVERFKGLTITPGLMLPCYTLRGNGLEVVEEPIAWADDFETAGTSR